MRAFFCILFLLVSTVSFAGDPTPSPTETLDASMRTQMDSYRRSLQQAEQQLQTLQVQREQLKGAIAALEMALKSQATPVPSPNN